MPFSLKIRYTYITNHKTMATPTDQSALPLSYLDEDFKSISEYMFYKFLDGLENCYYKILLFLEKRKHRN